ncbi:hypothetical protein OIE68_43040 [Nocardia vinacea]|uniref:DUF456 domain-containing protein n=1 Tax=Nocardia vinacea TaxID=96468 RepID=A0ABZ1YMA1_9NOCA|nr:hypothetical protein OIE68_43040 [Nocardia vinacea]
MGTQKPAAQIRPICRRTAALAFASVVPLSVILISTAPATADPQPLGIPTPYGFVAEPSAPIADNTVFAPSPLWSATAFVADPDPAAPAPTDNAAQPDQGAQASTNRVSVGNIQIDRPDWLSPEQATQINDASAGTETALSQGLQSVGVERARSDHIADAVIGDAIVGAAVGATVSTPLAATSAVVGAVSGLVAGLVFAPAGLVVVPVIGAAIGYAVIATPFAAAGAAVGAAVGAIDGAVSPIPAQEQPTTS